MKSESFWLSVLWIGVVLFFCSIITHQLGYVVNWEYVYGGIYYVCIFIIPLLILYKIGVFKLVRNLWIGTLKRAEKFAKDN